MVTITHKNVGFLMQYGKPEHKEQALHHPEYEIRQSVAMHNPDQKVLDHLVNDPHPAVRRNVAQNGTNVHREKLADDPDTHVRVAVAHRIGKGPTLARLAKDPDSDVRAAVARTGEHHEELMHDEHPDVRSQVAYYASGKTAAKMVHDPHESIAKTAMRNLNTPQSALHDVIHRMKNDPWHPHFRKQHLIDYAQFQLNRNSF